MAIDPKPFRNHFDSRIPGSSPSETYPMVLSPGDTLVCTESWLPVQPGYPSEKSSGGFTAPRPCLRKAATLTCVADPVPSGTFRPPYCGHDGLWRVSDISWQRLPVMPANVNPLPSVPSLGRVWLDGHHAAPWIRRYLHPTENLPDYGRDLATRFNEAALVAMVTHDRDLVIKLVQIGIDTYGNLKAGLSWRSDGGHGSGWKWPILFAGRLLNDASMLAIGKDHEFATDPQMGKVRTFGEDCSTFSYQHNIGTQAQPVWQTRYDWCGRHCYNPNDCQEPYREAGTANTWLGAALGARLMGLKAAWNHDPFFEYVDLYAKKNFSADWKRSWSPWVWEVWKKVRPLV